MLIIIKANMVYSLSFLICVSIFLSVDCMEFIDDEEQACTSWAAKDENHEIIKDCLLYNKSTKIKCLGNVNSTFLSSLNTVRYVKRVDLCGWESTKFDPSAVMKYFPKVQHLSIFYGNIVDLTSSFPELYHLQIINVSFTNLSTLKASSFKLLRNLKILDLRFNKMKFIETSLTLPPELRHLYLSGNAWNCSRSMRWIVSLEAANVLADRNIMNCSDPKYQGRHLPTVAYYKRQSKIECQAHPELKNCSCTVHYIMKSEDGKSLTPLYAVNCSHLNFSRFPAHIPQNTSIFYANDNQISDIRPLRNNARFRKVMDVYLDSNNIRTIDVLEAGYWLWHFRVLSLRRNQMQKLPVYALDNALENNFNAVNLRLSQNPWICDCKFSMRFQEILMKYHTIIQDSWNVTCSYINDDDQLVQAKVLSIQRTDVCKLPTDNSIFPLDLLNGILATLILLILVKLAYDYYHYKNYGHLPWIVTKIP